MREAPNQLCKHSNYSIHYCVLTSTSTHVAPSRDQAAGSRASTARGQGHGLHVAVEAGGLAQLDQHDVVIQVAAVVAGVADDLGRVDELLSALIGSNVVLTQAHLNAAIIKRVKSKIFI